MTKLDKLLKIDAKKELNRIQNFLKKELKRFDKKKIVIGLSGGLDSTTACYLAVDALGRKNVHALILPEKHSNRQNIKDALEVAKSLKISYEKRNITPLLKEIGVYKILGVSPAEDFIKKTYSLIKKLFPNFLPYMIFQRARYGKPKGLIDRALISKVNLAQSFILSKTRTRMILLYYNAYIKNAFVLGTSDRTEWSLGFYDKYGDGAQDVSIFRHLYKTQIKEIAKVLGVEERIVEKPANPDIFPGADEEVILGMNPLTIDKILVGIENRLSDNKIANTLSINPKLIKSIREMMRHAEVERELPKSLL